MTAVRDPGKKLLELYRLMEDLAEEHEPDDAALVKKLNGVSEIRLTFSLLEEDPDA